MDASRHAGSEALLFFQPAGGNTEPPPANDAAWLLSNGHSWEKEITYPVYAIPGAVGNSLMERLSWNSSTGIVLPGQQNTSTALSASAKWNIRLFSLINLEKSGRKSPSFWGFLLATLGTISVFCIICLLVYQLIQRRRRENMQQHLEADRERNPQFDLQHIKIPRELLARFPVYIYPVLDGDGKEDTKQDTFPDGKHPETASAESAKATQTVTKNNSETRAQTPESNDHGQKGGATDTKDSQSPQSATARIENIVHHVASRELFPPRRVNPEQMNRLSLSQTTCAICLDDFVPASSVVRELPCGHIFHPECIDASLTRISSLCPLCKKSVLDPNFCPISVPEAVYHNSMPGPWL
ncbi:E3 ubiquitin-protein ligase RNF103 [Aspergillus stella-maris]|uniref:E3 ubiquitin-protein ligase RNF103 n=1 Tax=Aspergillus stella-maris TaxID=1810926 RepID=UPI003CCD04C6